MPDEGAGSDAAIKARITASHLQIASSALEKRGIVSERHDSGGAGLRWKAGEKGEPQNALMLSYGS